MLRLLWRIKVGSCPLREGQYRHMSNKRPHYITTKIKESFGKPLSQRFSVSHKARRFWFRFFSENSDWTLMGLFKRFQGKVLEDMEDSHKFSQERYNDMGPDISCAYFVVMTGGSVKLNNRVEWIKMDKQTKQHEVPGRFITGCHVEGIDCSKILLTYYALDNFKNLTALKYLNWSGMRYLNDFWLARLHEFAQTLEFLDVSDNKNLTERGLLTLYKLPNLKILKIDNCPNIRNQQYVASVLEEYNPELSVIGVTEPTHEDLVEIENKDYEIQTIESRYLTLGDNLDEMAEVKRIRDRHAQDSEHLEDCGGDNFVLGSETASNTLSQPLAGAINR